MDRAKLTGLVLAYLLGTAAPGGWLHAQPFPNRAITVIVPFPPGGSSDTVMRQIGRRLAENVGQQVVIDNKAGAGGVVGAVAVKNAAPDGYTLYLGHVGTHAVNVTLYPKLGYDPVKDYRPITPFMSFPSVLVVPAASPAKSVAELVALAKSKPGGLSFTSQGHGTAGHLLGEMMRTETGAPLVHVPMKGAAPAVAEVVAGRGDLLFSSYISAGPFIRDGRLRMLAIASRNRSQTLPYLPTLVELGIPNVEFEQWFGLFAPARTPDAVVQRLNAEIIRAVESPEVTQMLNSQAADIVTSTPEAFAQKIAADTARLAKVVRSVGAKVD